MDIQGSFWSSGLAESVGASASSIDTLLLSDSDCTMRNLLLDQDVLQECKAHNSDLIAFICSPNGIIDLVGFVTTPTEVFIDDEMEQETSNGDVTIHQTDAITTYTVPDGIDPHRLANMASEIFACEIKDVLNCLLDNEEAMELLFSIIQCVGTPNPRVCGYLLKVVTTLLRFSIKKVLDYIKHHPNVLKNLVNHIGDDSIFEVFILLVWDLASMSDDEDQKWLHELKIIPQLVAQLAPDQHKHTLLNASQALVNIITKSPLDSRSVLIDSLQAPSTLTALFNHTLEDSGTSFSYGLAVMSALLDRESAMSGEFNDKSLGWDAPFFVKTVIERLVDIRNRFTSSIVIPTAPLATSFGRLDPPLGDARLRVVHFIATLLQSNYNQANKAIAECSFIPKFIDLFFAYPWHSLLHSVVQQVVRLVVTSESPELHRSLFVDANITGRSIQAFIDNDEQIAKTPKRSFRQGNLGSLVHVCNSIEEQAQKNLLHVTPSLSENIHWCEFVKGRLAAENNHVAMQLGGFRPSLIDIDSDDTDALVRLSAQDGNNSNYVSSFSTDFGAAELEGVDGMFDYGDEEQFSMSFQTDEWPTEVFNVSPNSSEHSSVQNTENNVNELSSTETTWNRGGDNILLNSIGAGVEELSFESGIVEYVDINEEVYDGDSNDDDDDDDDDDEDEENPSTLQSVLMTTADTQDDELNASMDSATSTSKEPSRDESADA